MNGQFLNTRSLLFFNLIAFLQRKPQKIKSRLNKRPGFKYRVISNYPFKASAPLVTSRMALVMAA